MLTKNRTLKSCLLILFLSVLLLVLAVGSGNAKGSQPSTIGLYKENPDDPGTRAVNASEDDSVVFDLVLENYNDTDSKNRVVLLYALPDVRHGDEDNWAFSFENSEGNGEVFYTYDHPSHGELDYFKYLVSGDGTPIGVEFNVTHDYEGSGDNDDAVRYLVRGLDYEEEDEPADEGERERFLDKIVGKEENNNITYLLDDGEEPNTDYTNELKLEVMVYPDPFIPGCYPERDSMDVVANTSYALDVTVRNDGQQEDELKLEAAVKNDTKGFWNITAMAPYTLGDYVELDSLEEFTATLFITAPLDGGQVPDGIYYLELESESNKSDLQDVRTVAITLLQRYDPLINLDPTNTDDKIAKTDGTATTFKFKVKNNGTLTDTIALLAEVQNIGSRAGDTNDYWTKTFYLTSPLVDVAPGETVDVMLNLTPTLNNEVIPQGKYPAYVNATSTNNLARKDQAMVYIRMPNLYNPRGDIVSEPFDAEIQIGTAGVYIFSVTNGGWMDDTFTLGFTVKDSDGNPIASEADPGDPAWVFSFEDKDTGATLENRQLTLRPGALQDVLFKITPPAGTAIGDYDIEISVTSSGPAKLKAIISATFTPTLPNLWIDTEDIEIVPQTVDEGKDVTIRVTVHLYGAVSKTIKVEFYYHTAAAGFAFIGEKDFDFGGKTGKDVTELVEFVWSARIPYAVENNIKVTVDAGDDVVESDETDNEATTTLTVNASVIPNKLPTITITSPENGAELKGTVTIKGTASDPDGTVERVDILVDGEWFLATSTTSWEFELDTTRLENWDYVLKVLAFDGTDYSEDAILNITVANEKEDDGDGTGFEVLLVAGVVVVLAVVTRKRRL